MRLHHLQRPQDDLFVEGVSRQCLPMVKSRKTECLPDSVHSQISLKSKSFNAGNKGLDDVMRSSDFWYVVLDGASALGKHGEDCFNTFLGGAVDFSVVNWLHHARVSSQECRIESPSGSGDDLSGGALLGQFRDGGINYSEFDVSHGLVTKGAFPGAPLEALHDALPHSTQRCLVCAVRQRIIEKRIGSVSLWPKGPHIAGSEYVPVELALQEGLDLSGIVHIHKFFFNMLGDSFLEGSGQSFNLYNNMLTLFLRLGVSA